MALIEFEDTEDGEHAIFNMNESEFFGKVISVHWAKNSHKQQILGKYKAIWHQQNEAQEGTVQVNDRPIGKQGLIPAL